jgi:hypothetical protein
MLTTRINSSVTMPRLSAIGAVLIFLAVLSGCGGSSTLDRMDDVTSTTSAAEAPEPYQPDPILRFVGLASDNEKGQILDPATGQEVQVFVGRLYDAASGRVCRPYRISRPTGSSSHTSDLACRDHSGRWQNVRPLLNLDNSRISPIPE